SCRVCKGTPCCAEKLNVNGHKPEPAFGNAWVISPPTCAAVCSIRHSWATPLIKAQYPRVEKKQGMCLSEDHTCFLGMFGREPHRRTTQERNKRAGLKQSTHRWCSPEVLSLSYDSVYRRASAYHSKLYKEETKEVTMMWEFLQIYGIWILFGILFLL